MSIVKNSDSLYLLLLFLIGASPSLTANSNDFFNIPPVQFSNQTNLGQPVLVWSDTIKNVNNPPSNIQLGCLSAYTQAEQHGCVESGSINVPYNETIGYGSRLQTRSQVVAGVTYTLGLSGNIVVETRNFNDGTQGFGVKQPIHPNFSNPNILNEGFTYSPYRANYCGAKSGCTMSAIAFLTGETKLFLYVTLPHDVLNTSRYEFNNLNLGYLRLRTGQSIDHFLQITREQYLDFLFSGSIEIDKRCFVSADQSSLSFPTIKSNMNNGVVGQAKLSVISTCHNLGYRTSVSVKLVPVGSSVEGNAMTLATSENGRRALGILFHPEHFPTQCEGGDSQPFYHYLLLGNHKPESGSSAIQHDIYFSLCKYGIPTPGRHTAAVDIYVHWDNLSSVP